MRDVSTEAMDRLEQLLRILGNMLSMPKDIVEEMITKYRREYKEDPSVESFLKYIRSGGTVFHVEMEPENAEIWKNALSARHIDFFQQQVTREDGTVHEVFVIKDRDRAQVALLRENMQKWISPENNEFDIHTFRDMMMGKTVSVVSGLSAAELYAFRENAAGSDLKFIVLKDKDNTYKIYGSDNELMMATLAKSNYDLLNGMNENFDAEIADYKAHRLALLNRVKQGDKNKPFVIVDQDNPNNFIYVQNGKYSLHKFEKVEIEENGVKREVLRDVAPDKVFNLDTVEERELFLKMVSRIHKPTLVEGSDFCILDKVDKTGHAFADPDIVSFEKNYLDLKEAIKGAPEVVIPKPKLKKRWTRDKLSGYINLPEPLVSRMIKEIPYIHVNADMTEIAFPVEKQEEIDRYLFDNLERKFKDNLVSVGFLLQKSGRSGPHIPSLNKVQEKTVYLLNADDPSTFISIGIDGMRLYKDGKEERYIPITDKKYNELLNYYVGLDFNPNPIFLTEEEMHSPEKYQIIWKRANRIMDNTVIDDLVSKEEKEKAQLVDERLYAREITTEELENLSDEQKGSIEKTKEKPVSTKEFTGSVFNEINKRRMNKDYKRDEDIDL